MITTFDPLIQLEFDLADYAAAHPLLKDLKVLSYHPRNPGVGVTAEQATKLLSSTLTGCGLAIWVMPVQAAGFEPNIPALRGQESQCVGLVIEDRVKNRGANGTKKPSSLVAGWLGSAWHPFCAGGTAAGACAVQRIRHVSIADVPVELKDILKPENMEGWMVLARAPLAFDYLPGLDQPVLSVSGNSLPATVTLTSPDGAPIRYTLDNTSPFSSNEKAILYTAPVEIDHACMLRAACEDGVNAPSNVVFKEF